MNEEDFDIIAKVYGLIIEAGVYKAESIKVAEAAKVIENSQIDINIAFINELSIIFSKLGIDPPAEESEVQREYGIKLSKLEDVADVDVVIFAVLPEKFRDITLKDLKKIYKDNKLVLIDIKGMFDRKEAIDLNYLYWRL